ncbi:hypothetical protein CDAR_572291 [Caerostris darwini]|uniref:Uncharacterized protein n=1 Tax=Caerostris darwini TaxID=1538125 RepID=A0AAV4PFJ2_9ARAC|nr:hypothetical protein CDAR_572291 [Caerostris darwini]
MSFLLFLNSSVEWQSLIGATAYVILRALCRKGECDDCTSLGNYVSKLFLKHRGYLPEMLGGREETLLFPPSTRPPFQFRRHFSTRTRNKRCSNEQTLLSDPSETNQRRRWLFPETAPQEAKLSVASVPMLS